MDHVAIMKREWRLIEKILSGQKTVESRWYMTKRAPWGRVYKGDTIYFKDSGRLVTAMAKVAKVETYELDPREVMRISERYSAAIGVDQAGLVKRNKNKRYCILIFLEKPTSIKPFEIDKSGFGNANAWLCVGNISSVKRN
jgi:ASC-1-like (ASCH) protein